MRRGQEIEIALDLTRQQAIELARVAEWEKCIELGEAVEQALESAPSHLQIEMWLRLSVLRARWMERMAHLAYKRDPGHDGTFNVKEPWARAIRKAAWPRWEALWQLRQKLGDDLDPAEILGDDESSPWPCLSLVSNHPNT